MSNPPNTQETPLLGQRTLLSAAAALGTSRLPMSLRKPGDGSSQPAAVTMTAGRLRGALTSSAVGGSKLPLRRPSVSGADTPASLSRPGSSQGTLKRTSSVAGLSTDADVSAAKRQLSSTMHELDELRHAYERSRLESAASTSALEAQLAEALQRTERLERQRALSVAKESETDEREQRQRAEQDKARAEQQAAARKARQELATLRDQHANLGAKFRDLEHEAGQAKAMAKAEVGRARALEVELERARADLRDRAGDFAEEQDRRRQLEADLERTRASQTDVANAEVVKEELHRQVAHLRALEKENGKLRRNLDTFEKQHANLEVLRESNKALEKKVRGVDALRHQAATLESELDAMKREKREWQSFLGSDQGAEFSSPRKLTKTLAATRIESATFREKLDTLSLDIHHRDRIIAELEARVSALERELATTSALLSKSDARARQEDNRQKLHLQEIEMLKRHLATYSTEDAARDEPAKVDAHSAARVAQLEELLEAHKSEVAKLAKEVAHYQGLVERYGGSTTEIHDLEANGDRAASEDDTGVIVARTLSQELAKNEALQAEIDELRNNAALMEKEIDALDLQVQRLTYEDGLGAYDPRTTKVLEMRENPDLDEHAVRTATLARLREENEALLTSLAMAHQRSGAAGGPPMVPRQSLVNARAEVEAAEATVRQKETMELRLKKAFSDKADEFRKAVQSLLGFRLDFLSSGRVKVTSLYDPDKVYALLFSSAAGGEGTMELLSKADGRNPLDDEVKKIIQFWGAKGCIPGLLASLSLTLFESQE